MSDTDTKTTWKDDFDKERALAAREHELRIALLESEPARLAKRDEECAIEVTRRAEFDRRYYEHLDSVNEANGRITTATERQAEALEAIVGQCNQGESHTWIKRAARLALAKAKSN